MSEAPTIHFTQWNSKGTTLPQYDVERWVCTACGYCKYYTHNTTSGDATEAVAQRPDASKPIEEAIICPLTLACQNCGEVSCPTYTSFSESSMGKSSLRM